MNAKIQALINSLREAGDPAPARMIEICLAISEAAAIQHIQEIVEDYSGIRAELCAAFLAEMNAVETEKNFIAEALEIKAAATELSSEEYSEACRFETALSYGEIRAMSELVKGASNTDSIKQWVLGGDMSKGAVKAAGLVEQFGSYVRLTPKGMKIAKYFTGALA